MTDRSDAVRRRQQEILESIEDPLRREQVQAQLEMAAGLEEDGIEAGGIFSVPFSPYDQEPLSSGHSRIITSLSEALHVPEEPPGRQEDAETLAPNEPLTLPLHHGDPADPSQWKLGAPAESTAKEKSTFLVYDFYPPGNEEPEPTEKRQRDFLFYALVWTIVAVVAAFSALVCWLAFRV